MKKQFLKSISMKLYPIFLHTSLATLAAMSLYLGHQNQQLRLQLYPEVAQLDEGQLVEPVAVKSLEGDPRFLAWDDPEEDRLLLVFTTSCPACKQNQTAWQSLHRELGDDVEIVGISLDGPEATRAYRENHDLPFEVVVVTDREAFASAYEISVVPFTFHIAGDGRVQGVWRGGLSDEQMAEIAADVSSPAQRG